MILEAEKGAKLETPNDILGGVGALGTVAKWKHS